MTRQTIRTQPTPAQPANAQPNSGRNRTAGRAKLHALLAIMALVVAVFATVAVSQVAAANGSTRIEDPQESQAQLPPAPLEIDAPAEEPVEDLWVRPLPGDCPAGMVFYEGECLEFVPPTDECPPGTIEHNGECLEFEVPDCGIGFVLVGLECEPIGFDANPVDPDPTPVVPVVPVVPPVVEAPELPEVPEGPQSQDDCPAGTVYVDGQCVEFEVPDCGPGFVLIGIECVPFAVEERPQPEPTPVVPAVPVVPVVPPVVQTPELPAVDCPEGTYEYNGECIEFELPDCGPGFVLVGIDCVPLAKDLTVTPADACPPGSIFVDGECIVFQVPDCDLGYVLVDNECVKLTFGAVVVQP